MSACCAALVAVLSLIIIVVVGLWAYIRKLETSDDTLPFVSTVSDIGYTSYLPAGLPDPGVFDADLAAFTIRTYESAVNRHFGQDMQLPRALAVVDWIDGHTLVLKAPAPFPLYIVAIAGTITYADARIDLRDRLVDFYGTHAHAGFAAVWSKVYPAIERLVTTAGPEAQFVISGHSLGAAVATLLALSLGVNFPNARIALYASATPRTGSQDLVRRLARAVPNRWHIANRADIIPTLPLAVSPITTGPNRGKSALYADFDRVVYLDAQSGSLGHNHSSRSYLCALAGGATCSAELWVTPPAVVAFGPARAAVAGPARAAAARGTEFRHQAATRNS